MRFYDEQREALILKSPYVCKGCGWRSVITNGDYCDGCSAKIPELVESRRRIAELEAELAEAKAFAEKLSDELDKANKEVALWREIYCDLVKAVSKVSRGTIDISGLLDAGKF